MVRDKPIHIQTFSLISQLLTTDDDHSQAFSTHVSVFHRSDEEIIHPRFYSPAKQYFSSFLAFFLLLHLDVCIETRNFSSYQAYCIFFGNRLSSKSDETWHVRPRPVLMNTTLWLFLFFIMPPRSGTIYLFNLSKSHPHRDLFCLAILESLFHYHQILEFILLGRQLSCTNLLSRNYSHI